MLFMIKKIQNVSFDKIVITVTTNVFSHKVTSDSVTPWIAAPQASLSFATSCNLLKLMSVESVMPSNHLILWHPVFLLPSIFPSIRVVSSDWALCIRWPQYWSFSLSISPSHDGHSSAVRLGPLQLCPLGRGHLCWACEWTPSRWEPH